eukprot:3219235-Pyramimonas_sp.AAC.1
MASEVPHRHVECRGESEIRLSERWKRRRMMGKRNRTRRRRRTMEEEKAQRRKERRGRKMNKDGARGK